MIFTLAMKKYILILFILCATLQHIWAQTIERHTTVKNDSVYIDLINPFLAPIELNLSALDSTKSFIKVNSYGVLQHQDTLKNALTIPRQRVKDTATIQISKFVSFKGTYGDPKSQIDYKYRYSLPYPRGKSYKIIQSFGGKFSHNKTHSRYAIDIGTQVGDTITAARPGTVVFVKQDSKEHCRTSKCADKGNKIIILHDDGSLAHYVHLDFEGSLVEVGDLVNDSQPIAISGMTGFTTTPHLHFVLFKAGSVSIPFKFKGQRGKALKKGRHYKRVH
jgi:murein DD-endopeptidase MepM/ murein hydrolase activator NlpD